LAAAAAGVLGVRKMEGLDREHMVLLKRGDVAFGVLSLAPTVRVGDGELRSDIVKRTAAGDKRRWWEGEVSAMVLSRKI
jgi:hypothetical protein